MLPAKVLATSLAAAPATIPSRIPATSSRPPRAAHRRAMLVALVTAVLTALALAGPVRPAAAQGPGTSTILAQVNASRAAAGLRPLTLAGDLSSVAYAWAKHMAATTTLAHNPNLTGQVDDWQVLGENVGYGPTVGDVESAFMESPRHRANILEPRYTQIGLGVVVDAQGTSWVTQVFRKPMSSATAASTTTSKPTSKPASKPATRKPTTSAATTSRATSKPATSTRAGASTSTSGSSHRTGPTGATAAPAQQGTLAPAAGPAPGQLLAQRLAAAAAARPDASGDPIDAALGWAAAMDALAG